MEYKLADILTAKNAELKASRKESTKQRGNVDAGSVRSVYSVYDGDASRLLINLTS